MARSARCQYTVRPSYSVIFAIRSHINSFYAGDGFIDENDLRKVLIELRLKFTDADVEEMIGEFVSKPSMQQRIDLNDFLSIVA